MIRHHRWGRLTISTTSALQRMVDPRASSVPAFEQARSAITEPFSARGVAGLRLADSDEGR
jgi:hypothetical protein